MATFQTGPRHPSACQPGTCSPPSYCQETGRRRKTRYEKGKKALSGCRRDNEKEVRSVQSQRTEDMKKVGKCTRANDAKGRVEENSPATLWDNGQKELDRTDGSRRWRQLSRRCALAAAAATRKLSGCPIGNLSYRLRAPFLGFPVVTPPS